MKTLIITKYYTTASGSARIKATADGEKLIVSFDYAAKCPHFSAAKKLSEKLNLGTLEEVNSSLRCGRAFIAKGGNE